VKFGVRELAGRISLVVRHDLDGHRMLLGWLSPWSPSQAGCPGVPATAVDGNT
jgi:hypothetical protein